MFFGEFGDADASISFNVSTDRVHESCNFPGLNAGDPVVAWILADPARVQVVRSGGEPAFQMLRQGFVATGLINATGTKKTDSVSFATWALVYLIHEGTQVTCENMGNWYNQWYPILLNRVNQLFLGPLVLYKPKPAIPLILKNLQLIQPKDDAVPTWAIAAVAGVAVIGVVGYFTLIK